MGIALHILAEGYSFKPDMLKIICFYNRERRPTWAEERRLNAETFGIPLRPNRGRGGYRGRGGLGFRGGRGRGGGRGGTFTAPRGFRGGFRGGRGGREFADFEYRVSVLVNEFFGVDIHFTRLKTFLLVFVLGELF